MHLAEKKKQLQKGTGRNQWVKLRQQTKIHIPIAYVHTLCIFKHQSRIYFYKLNK